MNKKNIDLTEGFYLITGMDDKIMLRLPKRLKDELVSEARLRKLTLSKYVLSILVYRKK